jgi:hypothetical protein
MNKNCARWKLSALAVPVMLAFTAFTSSGGALADDVFDSMPVAALEQGFWLCDYVATSKGVYATPIVECSAIMDRLQSRKFGGDYEELLAWWRENKPVEHERLRAVSLTRD